MRRIAVVAHSAEGGGLCFISACREGQRLLGPHMHPEVIVSAIPMALSMPGWESDDHEEVGRWLLRGIEQVAAAGADFFICPDNTAHIVLERLASSFPIPGIHIADAVGHRMDTCGWQVAGLLGTNWTMTGQVYPRALGARGKTIVRPDERQRSRIHRAIFEELCQGVFRPETTAIFVQAIRELAAAGAECAILGCTEIPIIINEENSPLPVLDSTRLLAAYAVRAAIAEKVELARPGWIAVS